MLINKREIAYSDIKTLKSGPIMVLKNPNAGYTLSAQLEKNEMCMVTELAASKPGPITVLKTLNINTAHFSVFVLLKANVA
jgi:hypothetical protein